MNNPNKGVHIVHGYTPMKESTWDKECTPMKESTWDKECTLTKKSTWYKEWTPLLDSLPDPFTKLKMNRKVQSKVLDAYLKPVDKMTVKYNKIEDKIGNRTSQDSSNSEGAQKATRICRCAKSPRSYSPCIQP